MATGRIFPRTSAQRPLRRAVFFACWFTGGAMAQVAAPDSGDGSATALEPVHVEDRSLAPGAAASHLGGISSAPLALTPLTVNSIDASDILDRGATNLSSLIRTVPSAGDNYNTFGYIEALQVRGFALQELLNYQRDGMTVTSHVPVAMENKQGVEILEGTSGMLQGSSAPGGIVNFLLKQPTEEQLAELDSTFSERGSVLLHGDFGGRTGENGQFGYRINIAAEERRPEIDNAWSKRSFASGFFDWRASHDTVLQLEFEHQVVREISVPGYGLLDTSGSGVATTLPPPIDPRINLNAQPWSQPFESTETSASMRLLQRLGPDWDLTLRAGTQRSVANDRVAFTDGCSTDANYVYNGLCGNYNVDVYQYISDDERRNTNDTDARLHGHFALAGADHEATAGVGTTRYSERYPYEQTYTFTGTENVFAPVALPAMPTPNTLNAPLDTDLDGIFAYDVAHFAHGWSSWLGARFTRVTESSSLTDGSEATTLQQHLFTPWLGLGYEPWAGGFAFASAGSGIEVGNAPNHPVTIQSTGASLVLANPGQALPAMRSHQVEAGFKQRAGDAWDLDATAFRIDKPFADNVPLPLPATGGVAESLQVAGARSERHQGVELAAQWRADPVLALRASVAYIDARTTAAVDSGWVGKPATNVAPLAASLQETWNPAALAGFSWRNIWTYAGHKSVLPDGSVYLPDYWQWDTMARYEWTARGLRWVARAGVDNLTDRSYWREAPMASWGSIYLFPAAARTARAGVSVSW